MNTVTLQDESLFESTIGLIESVGPENAQEGTQHFDTEIAILAGSSIDLSQAELLSTTNLCVQDRSPRDVLHLDDGRVVSVGVMLESPDQYDGMTFRDPFGPEDGSSQGVFFANADTGEPMFCSQHHEGPEHSLCNSDEKGKQGGKMFRLIPAHEVIKNVKTIEWLIGDMIERNSFAELFGESGTYKSFVGLDMALCVATGKDFHGRPVIQGPVVIIIGEGLNGYGRRMAAWEKHYNIDLADYPICVSSMAAQFLDDTSALIVENAIGDFEQKHDKVELVLIDTLNRNFGPGDENGAKCVFH